METVKVDNQKLQLLNERIAQTIEALNQVRMSAHSIQHTLAVPPQSYAQYGAYPQQTFSPVQPFYGVPYAQQSFMQPYAVQPHAIPQTVNPWVTPFATNPYTTPFTANPWVTPFATNPYTTPFTANPYTTPFATSPFFGGIQQTTAPVASPLGAWSMPYVGNGISHSPWDPTSALRAAQFSLGQHPYPVTIS
jgi:hypothetical protein